MNLGTFTSLQCTKAIMVVTGKVFKSYCLISRCWGRNQLHKEAMTAEEETIRPISPSPLWLPNKTEAKENGQLKYAGSIQEEVSRVLPS